MTESSVSARVATEALLLLSAGLGSAVAPPLVHAFGARATLTVTAISRLNAWILEREEFLAAVTGSPESVESADAVVSARLQVG